MPTPTLTTLESSGLIQIASLDPELEYLFRHALVQEAAYASVLRTDRKAVHKAVAQQMERIYPERLDEIASMLAQHYREAGETNAAFNYYQRAARHAFQKFGNREAEYHLRAALETCPNEEERAEIHIKLGAALMPLGRLAEAKQAFRDALPILQTQKQLDDVARVYVHLAQVAWGENDIAALLSVSREGLQEVGDLPPSENYAELLRTIAGAHLFNGNLDEAEVFNARALTCAEQSNAQKGLAQALITQGLIDGHRGRPQQAVADYERAIGIAEENHYYSPLTRARNNLSTTLISLGRNVEASQQIETILQISRQTNSISDEIWALVQLNDMYLSQGRIREAEALLQPIQALVEASDGKTYRAQARRAWLETQVYCGRTRQVIPEIREEKELAIQKNDKQQIILFSFTLTQAYWLDKDLSSAAREMEFGIKQAGIWGGPLYLFLLASLQARANKDTSQARETLDLAQAKLKGAATYEQDNNRSYALMHLHAREGNYPEAFAQASKAAEQYQKAHQRWNYAHTLREWAEIAQAANQPRQASELYQRALGEFEAMGLPIFVEQVRQQQNTP